jgi:branched-chain amino acid transport system substrate-binding protein
MKHLIQYSILFLLIVGLGGCDQKPTIEHSGKTIKVGIIAPISGPDHTYGEEGIRGMQTAMRLQPSLRNGDHIELVVKDDKNDQALTVALLEKLVVEDKVSAIITFSSSSPVLAMAKVADDYKTPILAVLATHPDVTAQNNFISQLGFDDNFQGIVTALFVRDDLLVDTVAVFSNPDSAYSSHLASKFVGKFKSIGGEITDEIALKEKAGGLSEIIKSVHEKSPELLYLPIGTPDVIRIVREVRKLDWEPKLMGSDGFISNMLAEHPEELDLAEGMLAADFFAHGMPLAAFGKKAKDAVEGTPTIFSALGVEGYAILLNAINRCNDPTDRECINRKLRSTIDFSGIAGRLTIGPNGKTQRPLFINTLEDGRSKFVVKVY